MAGSVAAPWNGVAGARCLGADGYVSEDEPDPLASGNMREAGQALGRRSACTDAPVPASASEIVHPVGRQRGNRRKFGTGGSESSHHGPVMAPEPPRPFHRGIPALRPRKISATVSADTVGHGYASCRVGRKDWLPGAMLDSGDLGDPRWRRREPRTKLYWRGQGAGENSYRKFRGRSCSDQPRFDPPLGDGRRLLTHRRPLGGRIVDTD